MSSSYNHIFNISFNLYNILKYINPNTFHNFNYSRTSLNILSSHYYFNLYIQCNYLSIFNTHFMNLNKIILSKLYNLYYYTHKSNNYYHILDIILNQYNILLNNNLNKCQEFMYNNIVHHIINNRYNLNLNIACNFQNTTNNYLFRSNNDLINNQCNRYYYQNKLSNFYRT